MNPIDRAYDPEHFRQAGHQVVDLLADHLAQAIHGEDPVVYPWAEPAHRVAEWARASHSDAVSLARDVLRGSTHLHHAHYVGHQVGVPFPEAALFDLVAAFLNNGMAIYEMGPAGTAIERRMVRWMCDRVGFGEGADGVLTSGGSVGNLTALLAARQARSGFDARRSGLGAGPPLAILAGETAHYSVARAAQVMGIGTDGVVTVPVDAAYRMHADALPEAFARAEAAGRRVFAVVASAGSSAVGAYDPIGAIAEFCRARGLWLHVDGAHGASAAVSTTYRPLVAELAQADSVVWDAHKLLQMPALVTGVLFRDGERSYDAFSEEASYLYSAKDPRDEWFNLAHRTLECTKRMMGLKLHAALQLLGEETLDACVTGTYDLARRFAGRLREAPDFELACEPESNIVVFRLRPPGVPDEVLDALQSRVRSAVVRSGEFYVVQTVLAGRTWLRAALMNPRTTLADLLALLAALRRHYQGGDVPA